MAYSQISKVKEDKTYKDKLKSTIRGETHKK